MSAVAEKPASSADEQALIVGLWGVRYQVADVSRSLAFYSQRLGFDVDLQHLPAYAQVSVSGLKLFLSGPGAPGSLPMPNGEKQEPGGWNRVVLRVLHLPTRIEALEKAGLRFRNEMEVGPAGRHIQ